MIANGSTDGRNSVGHSKAEGFQLLADLSSESGSDVMMPEFALPKRKIKLKRKLRNGVVGSSRSGAAAVRQQLRDCSAIVVFKILGILVVSAGFGITVWLTITLHIKVDELRRQYLLVEEGSKGTPVEFHGIHSQLKELQNNQSILIDNVSIVNRTLDTIAKEIATLRIGVSDLKKRLAETPELETLPKDFKELQSSLASMGSKITDFQSNMVQVRNELATSTKEKEQLNGELEALRQKVDSLTSAQHTTGTDDSQKVFAYVDAEVKKLDDMIVDVNTTAWDKLQWAVNDLHEHHSNLAYVTHWIAAQESNVSSFTSSSPQQQAQFKEQVEHVINEMAARLVGNGSMTSLFASNGTITVSTVLDLMRNTIKLYVALLANSDRLRLLTSALSSDKLLASNIDLNVTRVLHDELEALVMIATSDQRTEIKDLNATIVDCLRSWNSSRNDWSILSDQVNQLLLVIRASATATPVEGMKASSHIPSTATQTAAETPLETATTTTKKTMTNTTEQTSTVSSAIVVVNLTNNTVVPTAAVADSNGTLVTLKDRVFKPINTGGTFEDPKGRKPEDTDTD